MSHVVVGERIAGAAPHIIGHVIAGAGHFVEGVGGLFQTGAMNAPPIPIIARNSINDLSTPIAAENWQWQQLNRNFGGGALVAVENNDYQESLKKINFSMFPEPVDFSKGMNFTMASDPSSANKWQWDKVKNTYGSGSLMAGSNNESAAAERAWKSSTEQALQRDLQFSEALDHVFEMENGAAKDAALSALSAFAGDPENAVQYGAAAVEGYTDAQIKKWKLIYDRALEKGISIPRPGGMHRMGTTPSCPDRDK